MAVPPPRSPAAGGALIAIGIVAGCTIGFLTGEATIGFLVGAAIGIALSIVVWRREI